MIRPMNKNDSESVLNILRATKMFTEAEIAVADELIQCYLENHNQKDYFIIVIEEKTGIVGYLCYGPTPLTVGTYDLYWMAVSPEAQGRGYGKLLLNWCEERVRKEGGRLIIIETSSQGKYQPTRRFYLRTGYQEVARIPDFYSPGDDRVIYTKSIL